MVSALAMLRRILAASGGDVRIGVGLTALALAPAFTLVFALSVILAVTTWYPFSLVLLYIFLGYRAARRASALTLPPRWRMALLLGWRAASAQTLAIAVITALLTLPLLLLWEILLHTPGRVFDFRIASVVLGSAAAFISICTIATLTLGTLLAWLGAEIALRRHPVSEAP